MKSHFKSSVKYLGLSIIFSFFVISAFAQNKYADFLALNEKTNQVKTQPKTISKSEFHEMEDANLEEQNRQIENWMFEIKLNDVFEQRQMEEWMFDENFWKPVYKIDLQEVPKEKDREIEEWMKVFKAHPMGSVDLFSDFEEKEWMKKHTFLIL